MAPGPTFLPRLKPRQVPLRQWGLQVLVHTTGSLLNNWAFAFHVPLTVQIVFRSAGALLHVRFVRSFDFLLGLAVSMLFGYFFLKKLYTPLQVVRISVYPLSISVSNCVQDISFAGVHWRDLDNAFATIESHKLVLSRSWAVCYRGFDAGSFLAPYRCSWDAARTNIPKIRPLLARRSLLHCKFVCFTEEQIIDWGNSALFISADIFVSDFRY